MDNYINLKLSTIHSMCILETYLKCRGMLRKNIKDSTKIQGYRYWSPSGEEDDPRVQFWPKELEDRLTETGRMRWED